MLEMISIFKWTIFASMISASVLAFIGVQLSSKAKSVQVLSMSQGAILGVLIGMAASGSILHEGSELETHFLPLLFSSLMAFLVSVLCESITRRVSSSKNTYYVAMFSFLMAFSYLVSSMFPALESHMTQVFFGDLATLTNFDAKITIVFSSLSLVVFFVLRKFIINDSFEAAIYGLEKNFIVSRSKLLEFYVSVLSTVFICFSIQFLGLLFTLSCLFIPTSIFAYNNGGSVRSHILKCLLASSLSAACGLLFSLYYSSLSTVPCIVMAIVLIGGFVNLVSVRRHSV